MARKAKSQTEQDDVLRELPVTEVGLHQELEAVDRLIETTAEVRAHTSRQHTAAIKKAMQRKAAILANLEALRRGEMLPFGDGREPDEGAEDDTEVVVEA